MLYELLKQLKVAYKNNDQKEIKRIRSILNKNGMDDITISVLLNSNY